MITRPQARDALRRIGGQPDSEIDLAEGAMALAALEQPRVDLTAYRRHLTTLADEVAVALRQRPDGLDARVDALISVLIGRHDYHGDAETYDDLSNANLLQVIDRRRGLPVALGILYLTTARAQGWTIVGLNFPGHFLVRLEYRSERIILDPFNQGQVRTVVDLRELLKATAGAAAELEPTHYAAVGNRDVLLRLQNNLKLRHLRADRVDKAAEVLDSMLLFAPNEPSLWRESGLLQAHLGNFSAAIGALETFMALAAGDQSLHQTAMLVQQLKNRLN
ncbi:MAG: tetratricopeptide repeat protein [Azospirillum sp.]|nr:tetratricopeptide repeat protein [Azospirillum sp.]